MSEDSGKKSISSSLIKNSPSKLESLKFYLKSSLAGGALGFFTFIIAHPIEVIKVRVQSNAMKYRGGEHKILKTAIDTYKQGEFLKFYSGSLPNLIKQVSRNLYRWPLILYFPVFYGRFIQNKKLVKAFSAVSLANIECLIISPLERVKTVLISKDGNANRGSIIGFFKDRNNRKLLELYRGVNPFILRQNTTWFTFIFFDHLTKEYLIERNKKKGIIRELNNKEINIVSLVVAIANTALVLPFDYVKTNFQKEKFINSGVFSFMKTQVKENGFFILYTGWQMKILHFLLQSVLFVHLHHRLEKKNKDRQS